MLAPQEPTNTVPANNHKLSSVSTIMKGAGIALIVSTVAVAILFVVGSVQAGKQQRQVLQQSQRPNILLLLTDDQNLLLGGTSYMQFYNQHLVQQGTTFRNFFVHTPVCCPSRSSILTGRYIHNGGALNNSFQGNCDGSHWKLHNEKVTFGVYAQQAGYRTGYAGKYLNTYSLGGSKRVPPGWNKWLGLAGNSVYYYYRVIQSDDGSSPGTSATHGGNYATDYFSDVVANRTLEMIREFTTPANSSSSALQPFLIVNAWPAPHSPFTPAPWASNLFPGTTAPRTPNWNASSVYMQQKHWIMRQQSPITASIAQTIDETQRLRLETLQSVDRHIDQFIQLLEQQQVLDNTIVIYTSDNGFGTTSHQQR
jgi:N-acetylglucosamine-6-sulfatase